MQQADYNAVKANLDILQHSMITRTPIMISGKVDGEGHMGMYIVNSIEIESGSGFTYNVGTSCGKTFFLQLVKRA